MIDNCKQTIYRGSFSRLGKCSRPASVDGFCKQHHPDSVKERQEKLDRMNATFDGRNWKACGADHTRCIKIDYVPDVAPGTFVNPHNVLQLRLNAERVVRAYEARMGGKS